MNVRVGVQWRYIQTDRDGASYAFRGEHKVVDPPNLLVATFEFEPMAGHILTDTYSFEAQPGGKTSVRVVSSYEIMEALMEALEGTLQSGMEGGATKTWDRMDELLLEIPI